MISKIKNKNGSAFLFTLFLLALVGIITAVLYGYVITQTKLTKKTQDDIEDMYIAQGGIESATAEFISNIKVYPPAEESSQTETPNYIPDDSISHRLGRYILTLTEEIGIINGNMKHTDKGSMNASEDNSQNDWKNEEIGYIINNKDGLKDTLNHLNDLTRTLDENKSINSVDKIETGIRYLERVNMLLGDIDKSLNRQDNNKLSNQQKIYIKKNIDIARDIGWYLGTIIDKNNQSNIYYDYEYFISPTDSHADSLDTTIDKILGNKKNYQGDISILEELVEKSVEYINKMPMEISNLDTDRQILKAWENLSQMNINLSSSKSSIIDGIKLDLERAKSYTNKQEQLKYIASASIKLNKIVVMIGEVNADSVLNSTISRHLKPLNNSNELSNDNESIARITVQNARRTLKASQITCDYIQYKLSKGILNLLSEDILTQAINNLSDIKIEENNKVDHSIKPIANKLNIVNDELNNLQNQRFRNGNYIKTYDNLVKDIISMPNSSKNDLAQSIELLQEEYDRVSMINNEHYNSSNYDAEVTLNKCINELKNLEVVLNNLVIDNNYTNTSFSSKNNVTVEFSKRLNNTNNNGENLYVNLEDIKAKIKLQGKEDEDSDYFVSGAEIDTGKISLNPNRNLEFNLVLSSTVDNSKKNELKLNCNVYINNIKVVRDKNEKPVDVTYSINYKVLGMSEGR